MLTQEVFNKFLRNFLRNGIDFGGDPDHEAEFLTEFYYSEIAPDWGEIGRDGARWGNFKNSAEICAFRVLLLHQRCAFTNYFIFYGKILCFVVYMLAQLTNNVI